MEVIATLFSQLATLFYAVCAIAGAYFLYTLFASVREYQRAGYFLEKNSAREHMLGAMLRVAFCALAALTIFGLSSLAPLSSSDAAGSATTGTSGAPVGLQTRVAGATSPAVSARGTFTPLIIFAGQTPAAVSGRPAANPTSVTGGAPAAPNALPANNCNSPAAVIPGPVVAPGKVLTVTGTAVLEYGGLFRVELLPPNGAAWFPLGEGRASVNNAPLVKAFNLQSFPSGTYGIRVTTFRADGAPVAVCQRSVALGA